MRRETGYDHREWNPERSSGRSSKASFLLCKGRESDDVVVNMSARYGHRGGAVDSRNCFTRIAGVKRFDRQAGESSAESHQNGRTGSERR